MDLDHPCVAGLMDDKMVKVLGCIDTAFKELVADVNYTIGESTSRPHKVIGQILMLEREKYDIVAFALLREMFGFPFPKVMIVNYTTLSQCNVPIGPGVKYIILKRLSDLPLKVEDYYPATENNFLFRYQLCLIVYFCKFVGCSFSLSDVRVMNGVPYFWKATSIGFKSCSTITEEEFSYLFGIDIDKAKLIFVSETHNIKYSGLVTDSVIINEPSPEFTLDNYKGTMLDMVITYFRNIDFDLDVIRQCLYIKENPVRSSTGNRIKFPLSRNPRFTASLLEEHHSLLCGPFPFKIFRKK